ncbi:MAG: shikimate kinase [Selenomonadaceae bacterium]|nr:shikimate kinase [Selenomonadaceae bacterium]
MKNVVLIGFMGTGKSSVGRTLATRLGYAFIDMDTAIEAKCGISVSDIFQKYGEDYFRRIEKEVTFEVASRKNTVIATGGGTVRDEENRKALSESGFIIALTASVEVIAERTAKEGTRPLLEGLSIEEREEKIAQLLYERKGIYENADYTIDTGELSPLQVVEDICRFLKMRRG